MSRVDFDTAAGATRVIDFSTDDFGLPITDPSVNVRFHFLGLRDVCFQGVNSYYNSFIYDFPASTIRAELPSGTYAFGTALGPF